MADARRQVAAYLQQKRENVLPRTLP